MNKNIFIGCSSSDDLKDIYYEEARKVACTCINKKYDLVFGAYNHGLMKTVYDEYVKAPLNIKGISLKKYKDDLCVDDVILVDNLDVQIREFSKCDKVLYLPGSTGTLLELVYLLNLKVTNEIDTEIIIVNTFGFYDKIINHFNDLYKEGILKTKNLYTAVNTIEELNEIL